MTEVITIIVKWSARGFHCWPDAKEVTEGRRDYLASRHRHLFYYKVSVEVGHGDREIEFHDLLDLARSFTEQRTEHGSRSCEMLACEILDHLEEALHTMNNRNRSCSVWEDNEVGATITRTAN